MLLDPLMNSSNTVTTIASENIRDLWTVLDKTPGKEPSIASTLIIYYFIELHVIFLFFFVLSESSTLNLNAQRKALTARTTKTSHQPQSTTSARGGGRGGSARPKVRNWNTRDD